MRENYEIEKELKFSNNIAEVTSISLEEKHEVDNGLKGNFIVSGEYKIHEISLNKEKFSFKIPFECDVKNDIDKNTVEMEVTDFTYDTDGDTLYVTISYEVTGDRKDILLFDDEENLEEFLKSREVEIIMDDTVNKIDETLNKTKEESDEETDEVIRELDEILDESDEDVDVHEEVDRDEFKRNIEESKQELLNSVNVSDDNYITYQIHIVKSEDTLESILVKYNMTLDELKEYNEFNNLQLGDKLIIPVVNEE